MGDCENLCQAIKQGDMDARLRVLYAPDGELSSVLAARERAARVTEGFRTTFSPRTEIELYSGPGRTELGGNHTNHQHGCVLCASVDLDMLAWPGPMEQM